MLSAFFPSIDQSALQLPTVFPPILNTGVDYLLYDRLKSIFSVSGGLPGVFEIVPNLLRLANVQFHVEVNLTTKQFNTTVSGGISLGSLSLNAFVQKKGPDTEILASLAAPLKLDELARSLGGSIVPSSLLSSMGSILDKLEITSASFHGIFGKRKAMAFSGQPKISGIGTSSIEVQVINYGTANCKLLVGVVLPSLTLGKVVNTFLPSVNLNLPIISDFTIPAVTLFLANTSMNYTEFIYSTSRQPLSCDPAIHATLVECDPTAQVFHSGDLNKRVPVIIEGFTLFAFTPLTVPGMKSPLNLTLSILPPDLVKLSALPPSSLTIRNMANAFLSTVGLTRYTLPKGFPNILDLQLSKFVYTGVTNTLELSVGIAGKINVIPKLLYMNGANAAFVINTKNWTFDFEASGQVWLGNLGFDTNVTKAGQHHSASAQPVGGDIKLTDLANAFGGSILPAGSIQSALKTAGLDKFTLKNVQLTVGWGVNGLSLHFSAKPSGLPGIPTADVEVLAIDIGKPSCVFALGFTLPPINLATAIKGFIPPLDLTGVPGLGSLTLPGFSFASINASLPDNIAIKLPSANFRSFGLQRLSLKVPGVKFLAELKTPKVSFSIGGLMKLGGFSFGQLPLPKEPNLSIRVLLNTILPSLDLSALTLPSNFPNPLDITLRHFEYIPNLKVMNVTVAMPGVIKLIPFRPNIFRLTNIQAEVIINQSLPKMSIDFQAQAVAFLGSLGMHTRLEKKGGLFTFSAWPTTKDISISQIASSLGEQIMPSASSGLGSFLSSIGLSDFVISDVKMIAQFGTRNTLIFMGKPSFGSWPKIEVEFMLYDAFTTQATMAIGLNIPSVSLASIVKTFFPSIDISSIPVLGTLSIPQCSLMITNNTLRAPTLNLPFSSPRLKKLAGLIKPNVHLSGLIPISFPSIGTIDMYSALSNLKIDFKAPVGTVTMSAIIGKFFPSLNIASISPPPGLPSLSSVYISRFFYDPASRALAVQAGVAGTFSIVPNYFALSNVMFDVSHVNKQTNFTISGDAKIGVITVNVKVDKKGSNYLASAKFTSDLTVTSLINAFGASFIPSGSDLTSTLQLKGLDRFKIRGAFINVRWTGRTADTIIIGGQPVLGSWPQTNIEIMFMKLGTPQKQVVAGFDIASGPLKNMVSAITPIDISGVPYFGDMVLPNMAVTIASADVKLPTGVQFKSTLLNAFKITKGLGLNWKQLIAGKLKDLKIGFQRAKFSIYFGSSVNAQDLMGAFFPPLRSSPVYSALPVIIPGVFTTSISYVKYDGPAGKFSFGGSIGSLVLMPNFLSVKNTVFDATITQVPKTAKTKTKYKLTLAVNGTATLIGMQLRLSVLYDQLNKRFRLILGTVNGELKMSEIFKNVMPLGGGNPIVKALNLDKVIIYNLQMEVSYAKKFTFRASGTPSLPGFGNWDVEVMARTKPKQMILSWCKSDTSMTGLIKNLIGIDLSKAPFFRMFSGPSAIGVVLSSANMDTLPIPHTFYPLNETSDANQGLSFIVILQLPSSCGSDPFCNFFKLLLGNSKIIFRVYDIKGTKFTIAYRLPGGISFAGFKLYNVEAGMQIGTKVPAFGLTNIEMDIPTPDGSKLHFVGSLTIDPLQNADAQLWMMGMWQRAFFIPFLSLGNILARIKTNIACPLCISALSLGAEVWIGTNCAGSGAKNCIKGAAYLAIDATDPDENWAYASVNQFSMSAILRAMGINIPGMEIIDVSSCKNVLFSYSKIDRVLPAGQVPNAANIPAGVVFKGEVTILFFLNIKFDMRVLTVSGIVTYVKCEIKVGRIDLGLVKFTAASDTSKGPYFFLEAGLLPPKFGFKIDGQLSIPALSTGVKVYASIDKKGIDVRTTTSIFGFTTKFQLTAAFVNVLKPTSFKQFRIAGSFSSGLDIAGKVIKTLTDIRNKVKGSLDSAVNAVANAEKKLKDLLTNKAIYETAYNLKKKIFDAADDALEKAIQWVNGLCTIKDCRRCLHVPKLCVCHSCHCVGYPCSCGWRGCSWCCKRVCVPYPCPCGWTCVTVYDPICVAANAACALVRAAAYAALALAEAALRAADAALTLAIATLREAIKWVMDQQLLTRAAKLAASAVQFVFDSVLAVLKGLHFAIHKIWYDVNLSSITNGAISAGVDLTVFGTRQTFSFSINMKNILDTAKQMARKFFPKVFAAFDKMFG